MMSDPVAQLAADCNMPSAAAPSTEHAAAARIDGSGVRVDPTLTIRGDVCSGTGNVRHDGEINITGRIRDAFVVQSTANIRVHGVIEAAQVTAAGDLIVDCGIVGKDKGNCFAGHNVTCRYIDNAHLEAGENIRIHGEVANSHVACGGRLTVETGRIVGSHVTANGGVQCQSIGNSAFVKTVVDVGNDLSLQKLASRLLPQINRRMSESQQFKHFAQSLLRDPKRLTPEQKEEAALLLSRISDNDLELARNIEAFRNAYRISNERRKPEIQVNDTIYPAAVIRMPGLTATVNETLKGPMRIASTIVDKRHVIAIFDICAGTVFPLTTYKTSLENTNDVRAMLQIAA